MSLKLNLGSGKKRIKGFKNVDALEWEGLTDVIQDLTDIPYNFKTNSVDEIIAIEVLEHISFRKTVPVLREWHRILKENGKITIQVPAIDKMCEMFANKEICYCVAHKPNTLEDARGKKDCWDCEGRGKVNPNRWKIAFTGAQKHSFDTHRNVFTKDSLEESLRCAGFENIDIKYDKYEWKIIAVCRK